MFEQVDCQKNKSTLRNDVKPSDKCNRSGAGRPLTYPKEAENELVAWVLQLLDVHMPVSVLALQEKVEKVIVPHLVQVQAGWRSSLHDTDYPFETFVPQSAKRYHGNLKEFPLSLTRMLGVSCVLASTLVL